MRFLKFAVMAALAAAASTLVAVPASAAAPIPLPKPITGGIKPVECPRDGYLTAHAALSSGATTVNVGTNVAVVVFVSAVNCDFYSIHVDMPLGGGLKGDDIHMKGVSIGSGGAFMHDFGAQAIQAGTWTYSLKVVGYSFGPGNPDSGGFCVMGNQGGVQGWMCERSAQANLTITELGTPASPSPNPGGGGAGSGSDGGSQSQSGDAGATQTTSDGQPAASSAPASTLAANVARGLRAGDLRTWLGLALLAIAVGALAVGLVLWWMARPGAPEGRLAPASRAGG
jgi:hypothetical protein